MTHALVVADGRYLRVCRPPAATASACCAGSLVCTLPALLPTHLHGAADGGGAGQSGHDLIVLACHNLAAGLLQVHSGVVACSRQVVWGARGG